MAVGHPLWRRPARSRAVGVAVLASFSAAAIGAGLGRGLLTTYLPVLLADIRDAPGLIGMVMLVNAAAGLTVPLAVGWWSDRLCRAGHGRALPFVLGGSLLAAGGLGAVAAGYASTYAFLALAGALGYVGLNAVTTAHRALIAERFAEDERSAATAAEEASMMLGALAGLVVGGLLVEQVAWAPFAIGALVVPLLAMPTLMALRGMPELSTGTVSDGTGTSYLGIARRPGVRLILAAQGLWVLAYLALPTFFVLYADDVLGLRPAEAAIVLAGAGALTGGAMLLAGRTPAEHLRPVLLVGVVLLGTGLAAIAPASTVLLALPGLAAASIGFGVVSTAGFPLFSLLIPTGEEGRYTALYFAVRSIASLAAVPTAGWAIELTGSYRALFVAGGAIALLAVIPLLRLDRPAGQDALPPQLPSRRRLAGWCAGFSALVAATLAVGLLVVQSPLQVIDERLLLDLHDLVPNPWLVDVTVVSPDVRNYVLLIAGGMIAAWRLGRVSAARAAALPITSGLIAFAAVRAVWAIWERPRPEEVIDGLAVAGHSFAPYASYPSGHAAVTVAIVAALGVLFPRARMLLAAWATVVCTSRVVYGAHFPSDVLVGVVVGLIAVVLATHIVNATTRRAAPGETP
jgi:MFS family permease